MIGNDGNLCTTDVCYNKAGAAACNSTNVICPQPNKCIPTYCDGIDGKCKNGTAISCNDGKYFLFILLYFYKKNNENLIKKYWIIFIVFNNYF